MRQSQGWQGLWEQQEPSVGWAEAGAQRCGHSEQCAFSLGLWGSGQPQQGVELTATEAPVSPWWSRGSGRTIRFQGAIARSTVGAPHGSITHHAPWPCVQSESVWGCQHGVGELTRAAGMAPGISRAGELKAGLSGCLPQGSCPVWGGGRLALKGSGQPAGCN